jgi:hypothetical protein
MLVLPEKGFRRSVKKHNCDLNIVCDWLEATLAIDEEEISHGTVEDILAEQDIYDSGDGDAKLLRADFIEQIWQEMSRRSSLAGAAALYKVDRQVITRTADLEAALPASFLVLLCCSEYYAELGTGAFANWGKTGDLFEQFCLQSIAAQGWSVTRTGWASATGAKKLAGTVEKISAATGEKLKNEAWVERYKDKNEAGCDLVGFLEFPDQRTGRPLVLIQCAAGADYEDKLGTPDVGLWNKLIGFSTSPVKGFCTPRSFCDDSRFLVIAGQVNGWLMERYRLLLPFARGAVVGEPLAGELRVWIEARTQAIPRL